MKTTRISINLSKFLALVVLVPLISNCTKEKEEEETATDYSISDHWLSLPAAIKSVDVFYLYPTSWQKINATDPSICEIDNPIMLKYSKLAFARQATAFETIGNIYAPYYRQLDVASRASKTNEEQEEVVAGIPTSDAVAAFDYYITHYNNGRPFILAGHSLGSNVLSYLLSGYLKDNPEVYSRMIVAYVIGYSVTSEYLANNPHLKFAEGPDDIGVIVSYNSEAPDVAIGTNAVVLPGGIAINPITWTRDETLAPADKNLGSLVLNSDGSVKAGLVTPVMNYADAQVNLVKGVVICSVADEDSLSPGGTYVRGVYHSFDYPFYYYNIRENAANRTQKFLNK